MENGGTQIGDRGPRSIESEPTLEQVLANLGVTLVQPLAAPRGLAVRVGDVEIYDPLEPLRPDPGGILLLVGVDPAAPGAASLLGAAAEAQYAAAVFRARSQPPEAVIAAAKAAGIVLMHAHPDVSWSQLATVIRSSIAGAGQTLDMEIAGVRLGDLFAFANTLSAIVGGAVTVEDPQSRVLAYSSVDEHVDEARRATILGRRVPDRYMRIAQEQGVFRRLWASHDVVQMDGVPEVGLQRRLAIAVRAGDEILGSLWVAETGQPLARDCEDALRQAAQTAALHLLRHRVETRADNRAQDELLQQLIDGQGAADVIAARIGFDPDAAYALVALEAGRNASGPPALPRERLRELVSLYFSTLGHQVAEVAVGPRIYAVVPTELGEQAGKRLRQLADDVVAHVRQALRLSVYAAVGCTVPTIRDVPASREEVDRVMRVLLRGTRQLTVASLADVKADAILLEVLDLLRDRPHLLEGRVAALMAHDRRHEGMYVATLRSYLDHFGDVANAARAIQVHPNTFRYRLRRLTEIVGLDVDDPVERLVAALQLRSLA